MLRNDGLTTADIQIIFAGEIAVAGGVVSDTFDDGRRLFTRSILPAAAEVQPRDKVQGGVALRAAGPEIWVHPYVFRQVCRNGAIMAQALESRLIDNRGSWAREEAEEALRQAIRDCCGAEVFAEAVKNMRVARADEVDLALTMLPFISHLPAGQAARLADQIFDRFTREGDRSRFGLMNAVTSLARDTHQPELRWRLEELGGGVLAGLRPSCLPDDGAAETLTLAAR